jgi:hypothetical protein
MSPPGCSLEVNPFWPQPKVATANVYDLRRQRVPAGIVEQEPIELPGELNQEFILI